MSEEEIPAPEVLTQRLSRRAVQIAQVIGPRKTGKGLNSLIPVSQPGIVGIEMPDETSYLLEVENGTASRALFDLAGKVIPIRQPDGDIAFRRASANSIGKTPIITRAATNGRILSDRPKWVYPEKDGTYFLKKSLNMSVSEWSRTVKTQELIDLLMQTEVKEDINYIINGKG